LSALRVLRDAIVDSLAARLAADRPENDEARRAAARESLRRARDDDARANVAVSEAYGGLRVPARVRALVSAQREAVLRAAEAESRSPGEATRDAAVKATERFVLVLDAVVHGLGVRDARSSAKLLADVADDLSAGIGDMRNGAGESRSRGMVRADVAVDVLGAGGRSMHGLGELGRDLGEIVGADLARVRRAGSDQDYAHAELAARDLAARLRQPDPSFGSRGRGRGASGTSGQGGGESGNPDPSGEGGEGGEGTDDVQQAFDEAAQDLERLAQEHAGQIGQMERALADAENDEEQRDARAARDEARRHADAIRDAARRLPAIGSGSDSWTSKGAAARDLAEQMARSLEDGRPDDAAQTGRSAVSSLDEAKKMLQRGGWLDDPQGNGQKTVDDARRKLDAESRWAEEQVRDLRRRAAERARDELRRGGGEESKLAERAHNLSEKGRDTGSFPEQATDALDEAARAARQAAEALKEGDADRGLDRQHEAQRQLEAARQQLQGDDAASPASGGEGDGNAASRDPVAIPGAKEHKGPEEFRRRVVRGLGQRSNGALRDAVQRYAEGLLR
ncbi:MAG: DUF4175 domain-containing protein, partial [Polyangiaceae bacterium]|nr:DUF4175 domain-containing protein [Polyangiaceae bacterium]